MEPALPVKHLDPSMYNAASTEVIVAAQTVADDARHQHVTPLHLAAALLTTPVAAPLLSKLAVDGPQATARCSALLASLPKGSGPSVLGAGMLTLLGEVERTKKPAGLEEVVWALAWTTSGRAAFLIQHVGLGPKVVPGAGSMCFGRLRSLGALARAQQVAANVVESPLPRLLGELEALELPRLLLSADAARALVLGRQGKVLKASLDFDPASESVLLQVGETRAVYSTPNGGRTWLSLRTSSQLDADLCTLLETLFYPEVSCQL